ncbi:uncharacterized protein LOC134478638 [Cavia porcellus]|uniref:uncharacterized protein LOC134478638 n=1 Tax=Cavia porcellus TaxID=10141 RepID=UPI002FE14025
MGPFQRVVKHLLSPLPLTTHSYQWAALGGHCEIRQELSVPEIRPYTLDRCLSSQREAQEEVAGGAGASSAEREILTNVEWAAPRVRLPPIQHLAPLPSTSGRQVGDGAPPPQPIPRRPPAPTSSSPLGPSGAASRTPPDRALRPSPSAPGYRAPGSERLSPGSRSLPGSFPELRSAAFPKFGRLLLCSFRRGCSACGVRKPEASAEPSASQAPALGLPQLTSLPVRALLSVLWLGLAWFGLAYFGSVWFGLVWFGVVWCGLVWCGVLCCAVLCFALLWIWIFPFLK